MNVLSRVISSAFTGRSVFVQSNNLLFDPYSVTHSAACAIVWLVPVGVLRIACLTLLH